MADQQEQMVLVAKLVDQVSGKLKEINKAMIATEAAAKKSHAAGVVSSREHTRAYEALKNQITLALTPAMGALGVTSLSLAGAFAAVTKSVQDFAVQGDKLAKTAAYTKLTADAVRELQTMGAKFGTSFEQNNQAFMAFSDLMDRTARRAPDTMKAWGAIPGLWDALGNKLDRLKGRRQQFDAALNYMTTVRDNDQKKTIAAFLGLPEDWATKTKAEIDQALKFGEELRTKFKFDPNIAKDAKDAWEDIKLILDEYKNQMGQEFAPEFTKSMRELKAFLLDKENIKAWGAALESAVKQVKQEMSDVVAIVNAVKSAFEWWNKSGEAVDAMRKRALGTPEGEVEFGRRQVPRLRDGYKPMSFTGGAMWSPSSSTNEAEETMYRATLRALTEWYQQVLTGQRTKGAGGGNGYTNASFGGSGGAAAGGGVGDGFRDGGGYKVQPDGGTPGKSAPADASPMPDSPGDKTFINRDYWRKQLDANPALKERFFRHSLGENSGRVANQAVMEEAANRADIRGVKRFDEKGNLSYFQGYYRGQIGAKQRKMLEDNYRKVFVEGSDVSKGAIDNSSSWLAAKHKRTGRFKTTFESNGETFQVPGWGESGGGERNRYPEFRRRQLEEAARRRAEMANPTRNTNGGLLNDSTSFNDRWNDRVGGQANISVDFKNMPSWVRSNADTEGKMFKELKVNRGFAMPQANESE